MLCHCITLISCLPVPTRCLHFTLCHTIAAQKMVFSQTILSHYLSLCSRLRVPTMCCFFVTLRHATAIINDGPNPKKTLRYRISLFSCQFEPPCGLGVAHSELHRSLVHTCLPESIAQAIVLGQLPFEPPRRLPVALHHAAAFLLHAPDL